MPARTSASAVAARAPPIRYTPAQASAANRIAMTGMLTVSGPGQAGA